MRFPVLRILLELDVGEVLEQQRQGRERNLCAHLARRHNLHQLLHFTLRPCEVLLVIVLALQDTKDEPRHGSDADDALRELA